MSKHTPGPWKAVYVGCGDWDLNGPVTQEDWTLAAAAPELLEACKQAEWHSLDLTPAVVEQLRAAIAKATGGDA